jgi:nucleoid-associated protein YgaU
MATAMPDLGKQVGPLPLGAWVAVVAGGLGIALYTRHQSGANSSASSDPDLQPVDTSGDPGVGVGGSWQAISPPTTPAGGVAAAPTTNEEWGVQAINYLIASGYQPAIADSAIRKYLESAQLGAQEFAMVTVALAHLGAPPSILPAPIFGPPTLPTTPIAPVPPTKTTTPPITKSKLRYYYVKPGDTLSGIAQKYYHNGHNWGPIFNANKLGTLRVDKTRGMIKDPNVIRVGWKLIIP